MTRSVRQSKLMRLLLLLLPLFFVLTACTASTGIFASGNWQTGTLQQEHIRSLAVDPNNPQNIYAGDASDGVFVSADGGTTWKQQQSGLPPNIAINALAFDDPGKKLYVATDAGVYASADAAKSWTQVGSGSLPVDKYTAIAFDLKTPQIIYVASAQHGVFVSFNGGTSWATASQGLSAGVTINDLVFDSSARQLWAATSMGIYRSSNGGRTWQALNNGLPAGIDAYAVLPAATAGGAQGLVYAGTNEGFFISQDVAAHWQASQTQLILVSIYAIRIDIHTPTTVYIATGTAGVLQSSNSGQIWQGVATGLPQHQRVYALVQGTTNYSQTFAAMNNVYLYPGTGSIFDSARLLPLLLIVAFFYLLLRMSSRARRKSRPLLATESDTESDSPVEKPASLPEPPIRPASNNENNN